MIYFGFTSIIIHLYYLSYIKITLLLVSIKIDLFSLLVDLITMKVQLNNDFLKFMNLHSYSIYLLQRVVFLVFAFKKIFKNHNLI